MAEAREYDLYRSDYFKGAFCEAIGGACAADTDLVTALFQNPAALATGKADWDFDGDISKKFNLEPGVTLTGTQATESVGVGGAGYSTGKFGIGASASFQTANFTADLSILDSGGNTQTTSLNTKAKTNQYRIPIGFMIRPGFSLGVTVALVTHQQEIGFASSSTNLTSAKSNTVVALTAGALYDLNPDFSIGSWVRFPKTLLEPVSFDSTILSTNISYSETFALHYPLIWATGARYAFNPRWTVFGETDLIGTTGDGYLLTYNTLSSQLGDLRLKPKGRYAVLEPHWGLRYHFTEKATLHFGGYFETSRWQNVAGLLHTAGGLSYKFENFLEVIAGLDVTKSSTQIVFTFR